MAPPTKPTQSRLLKLCAVVTLCLGIAAWQEARHDRARPAFGGCGPTSLYALCQPLGVTTTARHVFALFGGSTAMTDFASMQRPAQQLGLKAEGFSMSSEQLRRLRPLGILHIGDAHFVALVAYTNDGVRIANPVEIGEVRFENWSYSDLNKQWDGRILVVSRPKQPFQAS